MLNFLYRTRAIRYIWACAVMLVLAACVDYTEEWHIESDGSGTVSVRCTAVGEWKKQLQKENKAAATMLFMPQFSSLSQSCARAGVHVKECRVAFEDDVPVAYFTLAFRRVADIEKTPLGTGRDISWRRRRRKGVFRQSFTGGEYAPAGAGLSTVDETRDGRITIRWFMPHRVVKTEGAKKTGRRVCELSQPLQQIFTDPKSSVMIETHAIWWKLWLSLVFGIACAIAAYRSVNRYYGAKKNKLLQPQMTRI